MGSKEFVFYIVWTVGNIAMFPILQYFYKHTELEEVVPQTAYSCEILVVAILGFRNHTRFNRLIKAATTNGKRSDVQVADRLTYFRDMNLLLSVALVAFGGSMFILCVDGYTTDKIINSNKFAADLLICNTNISSIFLWLIIIGIFHPARVSIEGKKKPGNERTERFAATHDEQPKATQFAYAHDAKAYYMESSNKQLTSDSDYTVSSSTAFHQPTANVVSIDDPFAEEPISFSMMNSYSPSAAADYYAAHKSHRYPPSSPLSPSHTLRSTAASPPPTQDLPPIPQQDTVWLEKAPRNP
ncbi:hypothetical protein [Absidia glauca]|uniref:Uncharacterized protein n=1 Tax=Absidia glauca TaxID=4829 RepID=A0A163J7W4_ABSGL|nr:hypothetical protein [Absidia glauca]